MKNILAALTLFSVLDAAHVDATGDAYMQAEYGIPHTSDLAESAAVLTRSSGLSLLPEEYRSQLLSLSQSLEALDSDRTPFCSARVATLLQRCTKDRISSEDRDEAAMLLTLCDRGRDYAPPMECDSLRAGADGPDKVTVRRCAMALDQHQNFQRTFDVYRILVIPEKCKSLNGIFNVDPSRETYRNITLELVGFLQAFARKEEKTKQYFTQWDDQLTAFHDATADLSTTKQSLTEFNEVFIDSLNGMMQMLNTTFDRLATEAFTNGKLASSELRNEMSKIQDNHAVSLALAFASFESSISEGLQVVLDTSLERQSSLNAAAALTIEQLMDAVNVLSVARQDFQALGVFVREMTSKAYNQVFLLDKKQHEVSDSLSGLSAEIKGLINTTHELNMSLTDMREESIDHFASDSHSTDIHWLKSVSVLRIVLRWLGLPPLWVLSLLLLSLPRFVVQRIGNVTICVFAKVSAFVMRVVLSHRKTSSEYDAERNRNPPMDVSCCSPDFPCAHSQNARPQIAYLSKSMLSYQSSESLLQPIVPNQEVKKLLGDWADYRTRARIARASRLPLRLYSNPERTADAFARTRSSL